MPAGRMATRVDPCGLVSTTALWSGFSEWLGVAMIDCECGSSSYDCR